MHPKLRNLLNQHIVASYHKQQYLQDAVGERQWSFDLPSGTIFFGEFLSFSTQVLGTESDASKTWLWSWANNASGIPAAHLKAAAKLRAIGADNGVDELTSPELATKNVSAQDLAMIAAGLFGAGAYYRAPYSGESAGGGGAVWLILMDPDGRLARRQQVDAAKAVSVFTQALMGLPITDHLTAFKGYMQWLEWPYEKPGTSVVATDPSGAQITAQFDAHHRLQSVQAATAGSR